MKRKLNTSDYHELIDLIKRMYPDENPVPLHAPRFMGKEKKNLAECIDSSYVSYVGEFVVKFERGVADFTKADYSIATVNGTTALHASLLLTGVVRNDEVITQPMTFVATCNAISYIGAYPVFVDIDEKTFSISPEKLEDYLTFECSREKDGFLYNKKTHRRQAACIPVHVFGCPGKIAEIVNICDKFGIPVIEDAAEALGSYFRKKHLGTFAKIGILSFNGNKIITTGGGGMILTSDFSIAEKARHLITTAKKKHPWEFEHDQLGYNYRMPNINAAVGCAQMEFLGRFIENKRKTAKEYFDFFSARQLKMLWEPEDSISNFWLSAVILSNIEERNEMLTMLNDSGIQARPVWNLMNTLEMYKDCYTSDIKVSTDLATRIVNLPSSVQKAL